MYENMFTYSFIYPERFYGLWQQNFFWIEFTDGSPDQATAYQKEKMKKEMSKRMSGNVNSENLDSRFGEKIDIIFQ